MAEFAPLFTALNTTKNLIVYVFELKAASQEAATVLRTLEIVQSDLNGLRIYAQEVWGGLSDAERREVFQKIRDVDEAILQMAKPVLSSWQNIHEHGTLTLDTRIRWTLGDKATVATHERNLVVAHNSLLGMRNRLASNGTRRMRARDDALPELVSRADSTAQSITRGHQPCDGIFQNMGSWADHSSSSVSSRLPLQFPIAGAASENHGIEELHFTLDDATTLSHNNASPNQSELRQSIRTRSTDFSQDETMYEQPTSWRNKSICDEILRLKTEDQSRRSSTSKRASTPSSSYLSMFNERKEEDRKRRGLS